MAEDMTMEMPRRAKAFEWNLNTVVHLVTFLTMFSTGVWAWTNTTRDVDELKSWRIALEQDRKERSAEFRATSAKLEERLKSNEKDLSKIDNLAYRLTVAEQSTASTSTAINELQDSFNDMKGDLRVMREILQRLDNANGRRAEKRTEVSPG